MTTSYDIAAFGRMTAGDRKEALGLDAKKHLPEFHAGIHTAHGITMYLRTREDAINAGSSRNKPQRVVAICPECGATIPAGNLAQHYDIHTEGGRGRLARKAQRRKDRVAAMRARGVR